LERVIVEASEEALSITKLIVPPVIPRFNAVPVASIPKAPPADMEISLSLKLPVTLISSSTLGEKAISVETISVIEIKTSLLLSSAPATVSVITMSAVG